MKIRQTLFGLLLSTSAITASASVQAAEVDISSAPAGFASMGLVPVGQYGTINDSYSSASGISLVNGFLSNNEEIVFTYSLSGGLTGALMSNGMVGSSSSTATTNPAATTSTVPNSIILATAAFPSSSTGTTSITNNSGTQISFLSLFNSLFGTAPSSSSLRLTYNAVSTVPLPATLLMFGTAVLAMFGYGKYKRKNTKAVA